MKHEPGERVVFHGHPSWRSMVSFYLRGGLAAIIVGVLTGIATAPGAGRVQSGWVAVAVLAILAMCLGFGWLRRARTTYTITDRRVTIRYGLVSCEVYETRLSSVQSVNLRQSVLDRLLGVGTVDFDTAGMAGVDFSFAGVSAPRQLARAIDRALPPVQPPGWSL